MTALKYETPKPISPYNQLSDPQRAAIDWLFDIAAPHALGLDISKLTFAIAQEQFPLELKQATLASLADVANFIISLRPKKIPKS